MDNGAMDGGPGQSLPTSRSKVAGLVLQLALAVVAGAATAPSRGTAGAVSVAITLLPLLLGWWWLSSKWFSIVLAIDALSLLTYIAVESLGLGQGYLVTVLLVLPSITLWSVGRMATAMLQLASVRVTLVDPHEVEVGEQVVEQLRSAGFRTEPDLGYALSGNGAVVVAFAHGFQPVSAEVVLVAGHAPHVGAVISVLQGGGALETTIRARFPSASMTLRQVFPGADVAALTERHLEALAWLAGRGTAALPAAPWSYATLVDAQLAGMAVAIRAHPLRHAARHVVLWVSRRNLDVGPLGSHRGAVGQVEAALAGG